MPRELLNLKIGAVALVDKGANNKQFFMFKSDKGIQPVKTEAGNPIFDTTGLILFTDGLYYNIAEDGKPQGEGAKFSEGKKEDVKPDGNDNKNDDKDDKKDALINEQSQQIKDLTEKINNMNSSGSDSEENDNTDSQKADADKEEEVELTEEEEKELEAETKVQVQALLDEKLKNETETQNA